MSSFTPNNCDNLTWYKVAVYVGEDGELITEASLLEEDNEIAQKDVDGEDYGEEEAVEEEYTNGDDYGEQEADEEGYGDWEACEEVEGNYKYAGLCGLKEETEEVHDIIEHEAQHEAEEESKKRSIDDITSPEATGRPAKRTRTRKPDPWVDPLWPPSPFNRINILPATAADTID